VAQAAGRLIERAGSISPCWSTRRRPIENFGGARTAAVFMCGLPFSRSHPRPDIIAAPVPSPRDFRDSRSIGATWWCAVTAPFRTSKTRSGAYRIDRPDSQSGCLAAMYYLMTAASKFPPYGEVITPQVTPLGAVSAVIDGAADVAPSIRMPSASCRDIAAI